MATDTSLPGKGRSTLSADWRAWIAENLLLGVAPETLAAVLNDHHGDPELARLELSRALEHPYLAGARNAVGAGKAPAQLAKRDWILQAYETAARCASDAAIAIEVRPSRLRFQDAFYSRNQPVLIRKALDDWTAIGEWRLATLGDRFAGRLVEVQAGRTADPDYERNSDCHKSLMPFGDFIARMATAEANDLYMTANNSGHNRAALPELWGDFKPPAEYLTQDPEAGFLWIGPAGTLTPLHHDLTSNFMAQVVGRKRVLLASPFQTPQLYNHIHCYSRVDLERPDIERFPRLSGVRVLEVEICPGDLLFIPVGWWHQVRALEDSITVSFTNFIFDNEFHQAYSSYDELEA